jgi:GH25 family lysozyme M1 (1,4-beta-N-acetylmuramidase)
MTFYGLDCSRWQGAVNYAALKGHTSFIFFKGGGGDDGLYVDSQFANNLKGARNAGIPHGIYWFGGSHDATQEANYFVANCCKSLLPGEVLVLDCETSTSMNPVWAKTFLDRVTKLVGFKPLVYMSDNVILTHNWSAVANANYGLWAADYAVPPAHNVPLKYWRFYAFQQYSDNAHFPGISGAVDADAFFATSMTDFYKYGKPHPVAPSIKPVVKVPVVVKEPVTTDIAPSVVVAPVEPYVTRVETPQTVLNDKVVPSTTTTQKPATGLQNGLESKSMNQHVLDIVTKALKTFVQAAIPLWAATNFSVGKDVLLSASAAGISAVWNMAIKLEATSLTDTKQ